MITKQPKISVVIPVCNTERYLIQCLDSVTRQTLNDIEIICVDDASDDGSWNLLESIARKHPAHRFKLILHNDRMSASQCRKDGVLASEGEYVMFLDSDDYLEPEACQMAYDAIVEYGTDILQYGTVVENCANIPKWRIDSNQKALIPYTGDVLTGNLSEACFLEKKFSVNIWNKIFRGDICREAFSQVEDGIFPKANDLYALFYLLFFAKSYAGINKTLYHYCFGRGMTGSSEMSLENFQLHCQGAKVVKALRRFLVDLEEDERSEYEIIVDKIEKNLIMESVGKWYAYLDPAFKHEGLDCICNTWAMELPTVLGFLVENFYYKRAEIATILKGYPKLHYHPRKIKNIVLYYRNIFNGGAQSVVADLCNMFATRLGEKVCVLLVTDEMSVEGEYDLLPQVKRVVIPRCADSRGSNYRERLLAWQEIIDEYQVDLVLNSMWIEPVTFWDMLAVKAHSSHPAYVIHCHSFLGLIFRQIGYNAEQLRKGYGLADAVVTLSSADKRFWETVNPYTYTIPNPCRFQAAEIRGAFNNKSIIWIGRIAPEKSPLEIPRIMERVLAKVPDAVCHIVGEGEKWLMEKLQNEILSRGLQEHIFMEGFHKDLRPFYEKASILLATSSYEGFSLNLFEAASFGLPVVTYDLPWLEYFKIMEGWSSVPQLEAGSAASAIAELLQDEVMWQEKSEAAYRSFIRYKETGILPAWQQLLKDLEESRDGTKIDDEELALIFDQISKFHQQGMCLGKNGGEVRNRFDFCFPWKLIVPGSRVIIYGGGDMGKQFQDLIYLTNYCEIVAFCDRNPAGVQVTGKKVISLVELAKLPSNAYDSVLIAIADEKIAKEVRSGLEQAGINWGKIIWYVVRT